MASEKEQSGGQDPTRNAWKLLVDAVPPDRINVARETQILVLLTRYGEQIPGARKYSHTFCCRCCGEEVTMETAYKKAPYLCGDCNEANTYAGWCRFCDGIPETMSIEKWRALSTTERSHLRRTHQARLGKI